MKLSEKRQDAAQTLVVPYDATPQMANAAYQKRLAQRMNLTGLDNESKFNGDLDLYEAKCLMQYSPSQQWRAELQSAMTPQIYKVINLFADTISILRSEKINKINDMILDEMVKSSHKMKHKLRLFHAVVAYEFTGLGGMMVYNMTTKQLSPLVFMTVYGSMLVAGCVLGGVMRSLGKEVKNLSTWMQVLKKVNSK